MLKPKLSLLEIVETIKRSSLPTVVTEGIDDYAFYRRIEEYLRIEKVSLMPVGGKDMVLQVFNNRESIQRNDVMFLVDMDLWLFNGIPEEYAHRKLITSDGYSIENDLFRDGRLERFLKAEELTLFRSEIRNLCAWFSYAVGKHVEGVNRDKIALNEHPSRILASGGINPTFAEQCGFQCQDDRYFEFIFSCYDQRLRGKTLIDLLVRHLSSPHRAVKFGRKQLLEIGAVEEGFHFQRLLSLVKRFFCPE